MGRTLQYIAAAAHGMVGCYQMPAHLQLKKQKKKYKNRLEYTATSALSSY